jgi:hypothetical protein
LGVDVILPFVFLEDFSLASGVSWDLGRALDILGCAGVGCPHVDDDLFGVTRHRCHQVSAETRRADDEDIFNLKFHLEAGHFEDVPKYSHDLVVPRRGAGTA